MQRPSFSLYDASAGSGKTYTLSKEYIKILLKSSSNEAYRKILAITFTNKAVEEMKSRIIFYLLEFSKDETSEKSCCFRSGCYVRFPVTTRSPRQCFCSSACRNALRRVRQRETHWFRQLGLSSRHRGPPVNDID